MMNTVKRRAGLKRGHIGGAEPAEVTIGGYHGALAPPADLISARAHITSHATTSKCE